MRSAVSSNCSSKGPYLAFNDAVEIAVREIERLGLAVTYQFAGFYAAPDARTEGADFAATLVSRTQARGPGARMRLLIACDGRVSVCPLARSCVRVCKANALRRLSMPRATE